MHEDEIVEVGIDDQERLYVRPRATCFDFIYREAMEIHWDAERKVLFAPKPREWTYLQWFNQIIAAAAGGEHRTRLRLTPTTAWSKVPETLRSAVSKAGG